MKVEYCPGCLRTYDVVIEQGCGSQRCPDGEIGTKTSLKKLIKERDKIEQIMQAGIDKVIEERQQVKRDKFHAWFSLLANQIYREHKRPTNEQLDELFESLGC